MKKSKGINYTPTRTAYLVIKGNERLGIRKGHVFESAKENQFVGGYMEFFDSKNRWGEKVLMSFEPTLLILILLKKLGFIKPIK